MLRGKINLRIKTYHITYCTDTRLWISCIC